MLKNEISKIDEAILLVIKSVENGKFTRSGLNYIFEIEDSYDWIITVTENSIEFRMRTLKWFPGSYEPVEGSELHSFIEYEEIEALEETEKLKIIKYKLKELK